MDTQYLVPIHIQHPETSHQFRALGHSISLLCQQLTTNWFDSVGK
jgi:hypothetical protein